MWKWKYILGASTAFLQSSSFIVSADTIPLGFRILSYEGEVLGETYLSPSTLFKNDLKSVSQQGFSKLQTHADWDQLVKIFRFIAGKPWSWCYHIYDQAEHWHELGVDWNDTHYMLNIDKCLSGHELKLEAGELIEWLPCSDFKIDFD